MRLIAVLLRRLPVQYRSSVGFLFLALLLITGEGHGHILNGMDTAIMLGRESLSVTMRMEAIDALVISPLSDLNRDGLLSEDEFQLYKDGFAVDFAARFVIVSQGTRVPLKRGTAAMADKDVLTITLDYDAASGTFGDTTIDPNLFRPLPGLRELPIHPPNLSNHNAVTVIGCGKVEVLKFTGTETFQIQVSDLCASYNEVVGGDALSSGASAMSVFSGSPAQPDAVKRGTLDTLLDGASEGISRPLPVMATGILALCVARFAGLWTLIVVFQICQCVGLLLAAWFLPRHVGALAAVMAAAATLALVAGAFALQPEKPRWRTAPIMAIVGLVVGAAITPPRFFVPSNPSSSMVPLLLWLAGICVAQWAVIGLLRSGIQEVMKKRSGADQRVFVGSSFLIAAASVILALWTIIQRVA